MIDTAIAALDAVFDWKEFLVINFPEKYSPSDFGMDAKEKKEAVEKLIETEELIEEEFAKIDEEILEGARFYVDDNGDYVKLEEGYDIDENGEEIGCAPHPMMKVRTRVPFEVKKGDILRKD